MQIYTDDVGVDITTGVCFVDFDLGSGYDGWSAMVYDSALEFFTYENSFSDDGTFDFKVSCVDFVYENLEAEDEFEILEEEDEKKKGNDYVGYCEPIWECGAWSDCNDGMQFRECEDINDCDEFYVYGKPLERIGCDMPAEKIQLVSEKVDKFNWLLWLLIGTGVLLVLIVLVLIFRGNR